MHSVVCIFAIDRRATETVRICSICWYRNCVCKFHNWHRYVCFYCQRTCLARITHTNNFPSCQSLHWSSFFVSLDKLYFFKISPRKEMKSSLRNGERNPTAQHHASNASVTWKPQMLGSTTLSANSPIKDGPFVDSRRVSKLKFLRIRLWEQEQRLEAMSVQRNLISGTSERRGEVIVMNGGNKMSVHSHLNSSLVISNLIVKLQKQQKDLQTQLENHIATIQSLKEDLETKSDRIAVLERELETRDMSDTLSVSEHFYLLREAVAEVRQRQGLIDSASVVLSIYDGTDSLASSGCSMRATVNAHFPLKGIHQQKTHLQRTKQ